MRKTLMTAFLSLLSLGGWAQKLSLLNDHTAQLQQLKVDKQNCNEGDEVVITAEGDKPLFTITFRAKRSAKASFKHTDGMMLDKYLNTLNF